MAVSVHDAVVLPVSKAYVNVPVANDATVPQPGYVYFPLPRQEKDDDKDSGNRLSTPARPARQVPMTKVAEA